MNRAYETARQTQEDWQDVLLAGIGLGLPSVFNLDRLIDQAERGTWSGLWWWS
ncbi:MAG: hypothetical protein AAF601_06620 [Pseudomonadota bacterium]